MESKPLVMHWIKKINPTSVLDVGVGVGTYSILMRQENIFIPKIDGIEVWEPYIEKYDLNSKYNNIFNVDAREWKNWKYDLVIFGDVLEHMSKKEALAIWKKVSKNAKYAIISIPIIHCPQGDAENNPFEEHIKDDWTTKEVLESFSNIIDYHNFSVVGVYLAKFDN